MKTVRYFFLCTSLCAAASFFTNPVISQAGGGRTDGVCTLTLPQPATGQTLAGSTIITISGTASYISQSSCGIISTLVPMGTNPVTGNVTSKMWVESGSATYRTDAPLARYIVRHWEVMPATNPTTTTGRITLQVSQSEFNSWNTVAANKLPTGPTDLDGIGRLRVFKYSGGSSDGTGLSYTYSGGATEMYVGLTNIVWNPTSNWWEISVNVNGFGGFFIGASALSILPVNLTGFSAIKQASTGLLTWKTAQEENITSYTIERSADGRSFTTVGSVASLGNTTAGHSYSFTDVNVLKGANYYRIKTIEKDGKLSYSEIRLLNFGSTISLVLYPNPAKDKTTLTGIEAGMSIRLADAAGKVLQVQKATDTTETIILDGLSKGLYSLQVYSTDGSLLNTTRLVKE